MLICRNSIWNYNVTYNNIYNYNNNSNSNNNSSLYILNNQMQIYINIQTALPVSTKNTCKSCRQNQTNMHAIKPKSILKIKYKFKPTVLHGNIDPTLLDSPLCPLNFEIGRLEFCLITRYIVVQENSSIKTTTWSEEKWSLYWGGLNIELR